jgi:hypothetical protein
VSLDHRGYRIEHDDPPIASWRRYRYVCACGKEGEWRPSKQAALNDHKLHKLVAMTGGGSS